MSIARNALMLSAIVFVDFLANFLRNSVPFYIAMELTACGILYILINKNNASHMSIIALIILSIAGAAFSIIDFYVGGSPHAQDVPPYARVCIAAFKSLILVCISCIPILARRLLRLT
jgi:hypothetical protein